MHLHRLRHTLATQAINRGMRLEAIAALLGHRSLEMTLVYARIADRVVADEYASVCEQIDALYATAATPGALPAEIETKSMARLRHERVCPLRGRLAFPSERTQTGLGAAASFVGVHSGIRYRRRHQ
jgi:Phage integrase family